MLKPTAVSVKPLDGTRLDLVFDNGERRRLDVTPFAEGEWFGALLDSSYFEKVTTNGYSVEWPDGQDISPEDLYDLSVPA